MHKFNLGLNKTLINDLRYSYGSSGKTIMDYVKMLNSDYNLNMDVDTLLKWFKDEGLFMLDKLGTKRDAYDYYYPKPAYVEKDEVNLFLSLRVGEFEETLITSYGHDRIIDNLLSDFCRLSLSKPVEF
jgi:hypothetical protein